MNTSHLLHTLNQKVRLLAKELNEQLLPYELYSSQWTILYILSQRGTMTQTELWQYLKVEAPTMTRTLARMEQSGWIVRKQGTDKRERWIQLSAMAESKLPELIGLLKQFEEQFVKPLTEQERQQLQRLLEKLGTARDGHNE